jgi:hypothetical protein
MAYAQLAQICAPHVEQMTPILRKGAGRIGFHVGVWPQIWMESRGGLINYSDTLIVGSRSPRIFHVGWPQPKKHALTC